MDNKTGCPHCGSQNLLEYEEISYQTQRIDGKYVRQGEANHVETIEVICLDCDKTLPLEDK